MSFDSIIKKEKSLKLLNIEYLWNIEKYIDVYSHHARTTERICTNFGGLLTEKKFKVNNPGRKSKASSSYNSIKHGRHNFPYETSRQVYRELCARSLYRSTNFLYSSSLAPSPRPIQLSLAPTFPGDGCLATRIVYTARAQVERSIQYGSLYWFNVWIL